MTSTLITTKIILTLNPEDRVLSSGYLVLEGDKIAAVGDQSAAPLPACEQRIDLGYRLVMPGLVNAHTYDLFNEMQIGAKLMSL